jgi:dihydrofolate reductase
MTVIGMIAAVGNSGQMGFRGSLPWGRDAADLKWFKQTTSGCYLIVGFNTYPSVAHLQGTADRVFSVDRKGMVIEDHIKRAEERDIFVIGGAKTYRKYYNFISRFLIGRIDYDGPADICMPELAVWSAKSGG